MSVSRFAIAVSFAFVAMAASAQTSAPVDVKKVAAQDKAAAQGAKPAKRRSAQQDKMARCNKDATGKKGAERKAFMKQCLSA